MRMLRNLLLPLLLLVFSLNETVAQGLQDPVGKFVGDWDLVGTTTSITIRPDRVVQHSTLGAGDIRHDNANYFAIFYRHTNLECRYQIKQYTDDELDFVVTVRANPVECELGTMRRAPGSVRPSPQKSETKEEDKDGEPAAKPKPEQSDQGSVTQPDHSAIFSDCADCPQMVFVPAGRFLMGSPPTEKGRGGSEGPIHSVEIERFAVSIFPVTRDQFAAFLAASKSSLAESCAVEEQGRWVEKSGFSFLQPGFPQTGDHPAVCVSWEEARAYADWISKTTGQSYRLLSESEAEYVIRAGSSTPYWWGHDISPQKANYDTRVKAPDRDPSAVKKNVSGSTSKQLVGIDSAEASNGAPLTGGTLPVRSFAPNAWGLFQTHGNAATWVDDCWTSSYDGAPVNGSVSQTGDCSRRVIRGGAWSYWPDDVRAAYREPAKSNARYFQVGFRIARMASSDKNGLLVDTATQKNLPKN